MRQHATRRRMNRRTYIYLALPLFVLLSCGRMYETMLGATGALAVGGVLAVVAWGVVWMRIYSMRSALRPEFSLLTVLPQSIYFVCRQTGSTVFENAPVWQNLYCLSWLAMAAVFILSMRRSPADGPAERREAKDAAMYLLIPIVVIFTAVNFIQYYSQLVSL